MSQLDTRRNQHYEAGIYHFDHGEFESAVTELKAVLSPSSGAGPVERKLARFYLGEAHAALAESAANSRSLHAAEDHLLSAIEINPEYADLRYQLARVYFATERPDLACEQVGVALQINPQFAKAIYLDGLLMYQKGEHKAGLARIKQAAELEGSYHTADLEKAIALDEAGENDRAYSLLAQVAEIRVDEIGEFIKLAKDCLRNDDVGKAESYLREALAMNPNYPDLHNLMGLVRMAKGDYVLAVNDFKAAIFINPRFAAAHINLGKACVALGIEEAAKAAFKQALAIDPENEEVKELLYGER